MNGRTAKLLRRTARAAKANERGLTRAWLRLSARERARERQVFKGILSRSAETEDAPTVAQSVDAAVAAERKKRAESRLVLP